MENNNEREELRNKIIKHFSDPSFKGLTGEGQVFESKSSVCSDAVVLEIVEKSNKIEKIRFSGEGCAISLASSDVWCQMIEGKTRDQIQIILEEFEKMLGNKEFNENVLGELTIFRQIHAQRSRIACAKLPTIGIENFTKII